MLIPMSFHKQPTELSSYMVIDSKSVCWNENVDACSFKCISPLGEIREIKAKTRMRIFQSELKADSKGNS